ncbi:hypothetical protein ACSSS7_007360 [Eimeria intestinalis]
MVARRLPAGVLGLRPLLGQPPPLKQQRHLQQQLVLRQQQHQHQQQQQQQQQRSRLCCWAASSAHPLPSPVSNTASITSKPFLRPRVSRLASSCLQQQQTRSSSSSNGSSSNGSSKSSSSSSGIYLSPFDSAGGVSGSGIPVLSPSEAAPPPPAAAAAAAAAAGDREMSLRSLCASVVKVYSDYTDPNYALPWQMQRQCSSTGSGFIVGGGGAQWGPPGAHPPSELGLEEKRILTNAHCVAWHNRLHVRKHGGCETPSATITAGAAAAAAATTATATGAAFSNSSSISNSTINNIGSGSRSVEAAAAATATATSAAATISAAADS